MDQFLKFKMSMLHVKFGRGAVTLPGPKFSGCFRRTIPIALKEEGVLVLKMKHS